MDALRNAPASLAKRNRPGNRRSAPLAARAVEGRAARLHEPPYRAAAALGRAALAFAVVDAEAVLEIAERAVGLGVVAQRRAAGLDGLAQHRADLACEAMGALARLAGGGRERARRRFRMQPRPEQRLADIDVAEPGDQALVEERRLERRPLAPEQAGDRLAGELIAERLEPEIAEMRRGLELGPGHEVHQPEPARVVVGDARAVREVEDDVVVGALASSLRVELAGDAGAPALRDEEAPAHAEMHDQHLAGREVGQEIFRPPPEPDHLLPSEPRDEALGKPEAQIRPPLLDPLDPRADHRRLEPAADRLDLGQLGHSSTS